ncbi:MAG: glutamine--tRNA ligase, partial [Candidatus Thiodiazotropha sp. (ex Lucinoma borealis)]|nr:glutamine--tRNA ligase [Candidatus Thiodiazotropha sp. (ex Lucinoma borealis)]
VEEGGRFTDNLNPDSLRTLTDCYFEPALAETGEGEQYQFEREGYFILDSREAAREELVFNRIITLRDSWVKIDKAGG